MMHAQQRRIWIIARTENGCENLAREMIERTGASVYFPVETFRMVIRGKTRDRSRPVLRNYVMVHVEARPLAWDAVRHARGVVKLLTLCGDPDGVPAPIPAWQVASLQRREESGEWDGIRRWKERKQAKRGQRAYKLADLGIAWRETVENTEAA